MPTDSGKYMVDGSWLVKDKDKFVQYRYRLTEFYILINGEEDQLPTERISNIKIEHGFEGMTFPIFKITAVLEPSRYYKLIKNKKDVKFKVRIQYYYIENNNKNKPSMLRDLINDTFVFFPDDNNSDPDDDLKVEEGRKLDSDLNELRYLNNVVDFFLFKDVVTSVRNTCNYVLTGVNIATAATYLLNKAGVKHVLMSPVENTKTYDQLILPPLTTDKQLHYLNNNFGFHKEGTMIYFGLQHTYLLNMKAACTAYVKKEWKETVIFVLEKTNSKHVISGGIIRPDEEKYYYTVNPDDVHTDNTLVTTNVLSGVGGIIVNPSTGSSDKANVKLNDAKTINNTILFNYTSNDYLSSAYTAIQNSNGMVISMVINDLNLEAFNPNKKFSIIYENPQMNAKYKGTYRIANAIYTFGHNEADFEVSGLLTFKKIG